MPAAPPFDAPLLTVRGVACRRGNRLLFRGLDLAVEPGTLTWLRGSNGVGKTSFLRMLAGLAAPEEGTLAWAGRPLRGNEDWRRASVYVAHTNALKDDLTLAEALAFLAALAGQPADDAAVVRAIDTMGLARQRHAPVRTLSQGQRRRGALARLALDDAPRVWVLDEPHDALDVDSVALLDALLVAHAARGGRVLLTSHQALAIPGLRPFDLSPFAVPDTKAKRAAA